MASSKKKYRVKPLPIVMLLTLVIGLCLLLTVTLTNKVLGPPQPVLEPVDTSSVPENEPPESQTPAQPPATVRLIGVGDNLIHEGIYNQAKARAEDGGYDFSLAYSYLKEYIGKADIASINQETVMVRENPLSGYPQFNSPVELGDYLLDYGFDVFNLANNHIFDQATPALGGAASITSYLDYWAEHPEAKTTGLYRDAADAEEIRTIEKSGVIFAFLGVTEQTNGLSKPADSEAVLVYASDEELLRTQIEKARSMADVVVVNAHWGTEYTNEVTEAQRSLAQKMADWGADIILGHHPHVLQPVEYLTRRDGKQSVVAYSLGNFISAQNTAYRMVGGSLDVTVTKNFETNETTLSTVRFVPIITHYEAGYKNIRNYTLDQYTDELAQSHGVRQENENSKDFSLEKINTIISEAGIGEQFLTDWHSDSQSVSTGGTEDEV